MRNKYNEMDLACYAIGYYEGRTKGVQLTMCETAQDNHSYQLGFEAGMTDSARYEGKQNAN